ncbi:MAG: prepilin-type N-terminal cleavage/methylation domain-containing protein [Chthoniobacterales bacterium]|nr:prepilin-type N-terminal cleavage/methylation domain-containing protein [Chthoniobacterales bacterium]
MPICRCQSALREQCTPVLCFTGHASGFRYAWFQRGVTLVEVLVVVAVIALLAALLFPLGARMMKSSDIASGVASKAETILRPRIMCPALPASPFCGGHLEAVQPRRASSFHVSPHRASNRLSWISMHS